MPGPPIGHYKFIRRRIQPAGGIKDNPSLGLTAYISEDPLLNRMR